MEEIILDKLKLKISISEIAKENNRKKNIKSVIGSAACFLFVITTGLVFAKDIEKLVQHLFSNSSRAIDLAVEEGYVQSNNMDYIYNNGIGVKVEDIVLDDLNLDISFSYETNKENVKTIRLENYYFYTGDNKPIHNIDSKYEEIPLAEEVSWGEINESEKISDKTYKNSVLFGLRDLDYNLDEILFDIRSIRIIYNDNSVEVVEGNWSFSVKINENMKNSNKVIYSMKGDNEYVESCTGTLSLTGLKIEIILKEPVDIMKWFSENIDSEQEWNPPFCIINGDKKMWPSSDLAGADRTISEDEIGRVHVIEYNDISIFDDINEFNIYIDPFDTIITITK